ncbi:lipoate--protein ligase family protein [Halorussus amylolyticus]|uniref:lipoate--protein ligase family protein n=1 Tax=Halorussus amylolyticus TaxID=1126242 RepID=UPI00104820BB|nr:lipoate--protein ligase family protein [Halorussus amylolyticus]
MRVLRGRADSPNADRNATAAMLERTAATGEAAIRVWRPHRQLAFGRRDSRADGYDVAKRVARATGFDPVERSVGGRAVAYTGNTVAFAHAVPLDDMRVGMDERYDETTRAVQRALWRLGVPALRGEPEASFCAGDYSLQRDGKLVGVAQRVRKNAALVSGVVVVRDHEEIADVLDPVYAALDVPFDRGSVGSVEKAGGDADPETVVRTVEELLVGDRDTEVVAVGDRDD